jgi:hypothetical protein
MDGNNFVDIRVDLNQNEWKFWTVEEDQLYCIRITNTVRECSCGDFNCNHLFSIFEEFDSARPWSPAAFEPYHQFWLEKYVDIIFHSYTKRRCCICFDDIKESDAMGCIFSCKNEFHEQCLASWISKRPSCPICKTSF